MSLIEVIFKVSGLMLLLFLLTGATKSKEILQVLILAFLAVASLFVVLWFGL